MLPVSAGWRRQTSQGDIACNTPTNSNNSSITLDGTANLLVARCCKIVSNFGMNSREEADEILTM